jgi:hypothetical protein
MHRFHCLENDWRRTRIHWLIVNADQLHQINDSRYSATIIDKTYNVIGA